MRLEKKIKLGKRRARTASAHIAANTEINRPEDGHQEVQEQLFPGDQKQRKGHSRSFLRPSTASMGYGNFDTTRSRRRATALLDFAFHKGKLWVEISVGWRWNRRS